MATVREFSVALAREFSKFESFEDVQGLEQRLRELGAVEAARAVFEVDDVTREQCGITLAD